MKVQNITNIDEFFSIINSCKNKIELVTDEGDRLNLKSQLSRYVALANVFSNGTIKNMEIVAYDPDDVMKIANYLAYGKKK